jgi:hypothetical protein
MSDLEWESSTLLCKNMIHRSIGIIIEAHPDVYNEMKKMKWLGKENVRVCFGKWQDVIPQWIQEGVKVDGIFYDTYGERFLVLEDFHSYVLPNLLDSPNGVYSFFNGLARDNLFFHGVACQCVKLQFWHLLDSRRSLCRAKLQSSNKRNGKAFDRSIGMDVILIINRTSLGKQPTKLLLVVLRKEKKKDKGSCISTRKRRQWNECQTTKGK